jgi:hypothetical protein
MLRRIPFYPTAIDSDAAEGYQPHLLSQPYDLREQSCEPIVMAFDEAVESAKVWALLTAKNDVTDLIATGFG